LSRLKEARKFVEAKNYEGALRLVNKQLDDNPDDAEALYIFGFIALEQERLGLARLALRRVVELTPEVPGVWNAYGRTFQEGHDLNQGESAFQRELALNPQSVDALVNLGLIYLVRSNPKRVLQFMDRALKIEPENKSAVFDMRIRA